ncbi:hypothetical protein MIND_00067000 [Mycena indigotica]|uniref:Uncharacterized protein n=1 Tax=Mycena indigotica TaxID=2126181 RepID=A0A8H6TEX6_9AGAR|nr:uncharacterized protein MIND_00067000 [Mycena indigotica]KAF7315517.1 hypothetical protein MIND_00067000 [Mycena indigotica]
MSGAEAQDALFKSEPVPSSLTRANTRLQFPPSYVVVGCYRLFTDKLLYVPAWKKCQHGTQRGAVVGLIWAFLTFGLQKKFIEVFLANSPRVTGLSTDTVFGCKVPFSVHTYAAALLLGSQVTWILRFFLARNIRVARERAWEQTVASRGKSADFWIPYVEVRPPRADILPFMRCRNGSTRRASSSTRGPGACRSSGWATQSSLQSSTSSFSHSTCTPASASSSPRGSRASAPRTNSTARRYFAAKKMTDEQVAVFMEERKWDYRGTAFGFAAALLEGLPIVGLVFTVSNRVGAAMWAHDLEKRQHYVAAQQVAKGK